METPTINHKMPSYAQGIVPVLKRSRPQDIETPIKESERPAREDYKKQEKSTHSIQKHPRTNAHGCNKNAPKTNGPQQVETPNKTL
jgi:hypothetical protein